MAHNPTILEGDRRLVGSSADFGGEIEKGRQERGLTRSGGRQESFSCVCSPLHLNVVASEAVAKMCDACPLNMQPPESRKESSVITAEPNWYSVLYCSWSGVSYDAVSMRNTCRLRCNEAWI